MSSREVFAKKMLERLDQLRPDLASTNKPGVAPTSKPAAAPSPSSTKKTLTSDIGRRMRAALAHLQNQE